MLADGVLCGISLKRNGIVKACNNNAAAAEGTYTPVPVIQGRIYNRRRQGPGFTLVVAVRNNAFSERTNMCDSVSGRHHSKPAVLKPGYRRPGKVIENAAVVFANNIKFL